MAKKGNYKIPFENGNLQSYPILTDEWRDNYVFEDTLTYKTYSRGRSSVLVIFEDSIGNSYGMFMSDFDYLLTKKGLDKTKVTGKWTFIKKGQNFGIRLCENDDE